TVRGRYGSLVNDLYVVEVASGRKARLTRDRRASSPSFAPDGRRLAFVGSEGGTANVFVLDLDTGEETPLTRFEGDVQITAARWSPRGDRIALAVFDAEGNRRLVTADAETGALLPLPAGLGLPLDVRDDRRPVWRPDGEALAYTSLRDDAPNVFALELVEGPVAERTVDGGQWTAEEAAPSSSPRGGAPEGGDEAVLHPDTLTTKPDAADGFVPDGFDPDGARADSRPLRAASEAEGLADESPSSFTPSLLTPSLPEEERVTFLFDGDTVHDWLPPDAAHPEGRLVLVATETKRRDRV